MSVVGQIVKFAVSLIALEVKQRLKARRAAPSPSPLPKGFTLGARVEPGVVSEEFKAKLRLVRGSR